MTKKNTVNNDVLKACAVLSDYNWFKVTTKTAEKTEEFYGTGIIAQHDGDIIKIEKQFATPLYAAGFVGVTAEAENRFTFDMFGGSVAVIEGLEKDFADPNQYNRGFDNVEKMLCDLDTLEALVDYDRSGSEAEGLYVVLDLRKLGQLAAIDEAKLKKFMDCYCGGQATKYQTPRTIYFRFDGDEIYSGLWDYATENYLTEKRFRPAFITDKYVNTYTAKMQMDTVRKLAQSVTAAI